MPTQYHCDCGAYVTAKELMPPYGCRMCVCSCCGERLTGAPANLPEDITSVRQTDGTTKRYHREPCKESKAPF